MRANIAIYSNSKLRYFNSQARIHCSHTVGRISLVFRKGPGTKDAIAASHVLYERNLECNNIQIWTAVECNGVIYCTVVTS